MSLGFYGWIRDNIRKAVLLGLSDAVEQMGAAGEQNDISPNLLAVLRDSTPVNNPPRIGNESSVPFERRPRKHQPRRLGRSLGDVAASPAATASTA
jgi:hypothetical protein